MPPVLIINSISPWTNVRHFADGTFSCIFVTKKFWISIRISPKFVPKGPVDNNPALLKIMAWHRIGNKPLFEPMPTRFTDTYMRHYGETSFKNLGAVSIKRCRLTSIWTPIPIPGKTVFISMFSLKILWLFTHCPCHYNDVIMGAIASQITNLTIVNSTVYSGTDKKIKHQSSASLAFVRGIHRGPVNSPHKWPVTRECFHLMTSSWSNPSYIVFMVFSNDT